MNDTIITVVGNLVDRPSLRMVENGVTVSNFRVASTSRRYDREAQQYVDRDTLFVKVTCWRRMADNAAQSLSQGDPVVVTGRCYTRFYEVGGVTKLSFEMEASGIGPDLNYGQAKFSRMRRSQPTGDAVDSAGAADTAGDAFGAATASLPADFVEVVGSIADDDFDRAGEPEPEDTELLESGVG